jgi:hypothetical protein
MAPSTNQVESILADAVDIAGERERREFLARACAGDEALRRRVEELLANHDAAGVSFLECPPSGLLETVNERDAGDAGGGRHLSEGPGTVVGGRYKLLEQIGEGGFGPTSCGT